MAPQVSDELSPGSTKINGSTPRPGISTGEVLGLHEAASLAGGHMLDALSRLKSVNPRLAEVVTEDGFGSNLTNSTISYREWAMLALAVLISIGDTTDQLDMYLGAALKNGATETEILDLINFTSLYVGAPRAVNAMRRMTGHLDASRGYSIPAYEERVVRLGDHDTIVRDSRGDGVPFLLIHCLGMDSRMWRDVFPQLAAKGRVISYDMRGHGYARAAPLTQSLEHLADDARLLLETLGIQQADVFGQSYGGAVAQYMAVGYQERVRSLGLITTAGKAWPEGLWAARGTRAQQHGMQSLMVESLIRWFTPETIALNGWAVRYARKCVESARVEDWAAAWRAMDGLDCLHRLHELKMPVLVVAGTQDPSTTPAMMKEVANACRDAVYKELNPGTHFMGMEQPNELCMEILLFRERVDKDHGA
ncbi:hypothetical protein MMC08_004608 [Hypocenomyce scalaris]|nr:hypothetical protein [Hypocenomyce scalaris]